MDYGSAKRWLPFEIMPWWGKGSFLGIGAFSKLGWLSGFMYWIAPWCFGVLVCKEDFIGVMPSILLGREFVLHSRSRVRWGLYLCEKGLEGLLL